MKLAQSRPRLAAFCVTALILGSTAPARAQTPPTPIPEQPDAQIVPEFVGEAAVPNPVPMTPQNPFMAPNGRSNMHNDAYMTDTYLTRGPLGHEPEVLSMLTALSGGICATVTFDSAGRIVTVCIGPETARLLLVDPVTLATLAAFDLPAERVGALTVAGAYFFLDDLDRAVIPTIERQILMVAIDSGPDGPGLEVDRVYDLTGVVPEEDNITSVLPDFSGFLWFVTTGGLVGTIDPDGGVTGNPVRLDGEEIHNSLSVDETGGAFIVSDHALYRFDADLFGAPAITWREPYDRGRRLKPGQFSQGSGTTPTLMGEEFVAITDNADPRMHVLVYRRAAEVDGPRLVCSEPVFGHRRSATENSLIATDRSIIVENNYGYTGLEATRGGRATAPGVTRIDLDFEFDNGGCHTVWESAERVPNVVSKLSLEPGLMYTYTKDPGPGTTDAWYFTAIDFHTGETVFKRLTGTGDYYNSHYAGLYVGPDGTAYVGVGGGLIAVRDVPAGTREPVGPVAASGGDR